MVFSAIKANHLKVNSLKALFSPLYKRKDESYIPLSINAVVITTHFSIGISWFSNLFETDETGKPWWIMCSYIRFGHSNRYWKNRSFDHPQAEFDILSFQKTYKWAIKPRGPKSNSSELLCLPWLPATLMMIRSKMNELAWRHHFSIINRWEIF